MRICKLDAIEREKDRDEEAKVFFGPLRFRNKMEFMLITAFTEWSALQALH